MWTPPLQPRRRPLPLLALLAALAPVACSSTSQTTPQVRIDSASPTAKVEEPTDNLLVSITLAPRPEKLTVDGDLAEWGTFPAPVPEIGPSDPKAAGARRAQEPSSRVALAMGSTGLAIAGEMSPSHETGFWVTVVLDMPEVPSIGYWQRGGGVAPLYCDESMEPDSLAECQKLVSAHEAFEGEHIGRFQAQYFVHPAGVTVHGSGTSTRVQGAQVAFKKVEKGFLVEATVPSAALPRTQQAPLESFDAYARGGDLAKPPALPPEEWSRLVLKDGVGFEPLAELRAAVFAAAMRRPPYKPFSMSYQPGDGLQVEDLLYAGSTQLFASDEILYSKQATMGDLEVGFAYTGKASMGVGWVSVASLHKGAPVAIMDLSGAPRGVVQRNGQIHTFAYSSWENDDGVTSWAAWEAVGFGPDGAPALELVEEASLPPLVGPVESHAPDYSTFSITGAVFDFETGTLGATTEYAWSWDAKAGRYTVKVKELSPGAAKKKPKGKPGAKATKAPKK